MADSGLRELIIENRHTGERLAMRRVQRGDEVRLELKGSRSVGIAVRPDSFRLAGWPWLFLPLADGTTC